MFKNQIRRLKERYRAIKMNNSLKRQLSDCKTSHRKEVKDIQDKLDTEKKAFTDYKRLVAGLDIDYLVEVVGEDYETVVMRIKEDMKTLPSHVRKTLNEYLSIHKIGLLHQYSQTTGSEAIERHKVGAMMVIHNLLKLVGSIEKPKQKYDPITRTRVD